MTPYIVTWALALFVAVVSVLFYGAGYGEDAMITGVCALGLAVEATNGYVLARRTTRTTQCTE